MTIMMAVLLTLGFWQSSEPAPGALELRLVLDAPAPGSFELKDEAGETLILSPDVVVTARDVVKAEILDSVTLGAFAVAVHFSPEAAERMRKVSSENVGGRMAFLLDGKIFMAPYMRSTLASPVLIDGNFSRKEAARIAERLAPPEAPDSPESP